VSVENVVRVNDSGFGHALLKAREADGREVSEVLPVRKVTADTLEVLGSPGYLVGFAAGDVLKVAADHSFEVAERGPNICVQVFADPPLTTEAVGDLRSRFSADGGIVESPQHRSFAVATVPSAAGVPQITEIMSGWLERAGGRVEWQFGSPAA
jgi:hypothetical protein